MIFAIGFVMFMAASYIRRLWGSKRGAPVNGADMVWLPLYLVGPACMVASLVILSVKYLP